MFRIHPVLAALALSFAASTIHAASLPDGVVYSANEGDGSISAITLRSGKVRTSPIRVSPHNVQISPDGRTLLAVGMPVTGAMGKDSEDSHGHGGSTHGADASLLVLDARQPDKVLTQLPSGDHPAHVVASPDGHYAYISNSGANQVSVIDLSAKKTRVTVPTGRFPHGLRLSPDGHTLYVANVEDNSVSVIDTDTLREITRIPVGKAPVQVAFTPDGKQVYVSLRDENSVGVIDTATRQVIKRIRVGSQPIQLFAAAGGKRMYVANQGTEQHPDQTVSVIDTGNGKVTHTIVTGKGAHGIVASDDGNFVFITNNKANTVSAINTSTQAVVGTYRVGPNPNGITYRANRS